MKQYPSIPGAGAHGVIKGLPCIAFKKYDGSNLRFEWSHKKGWHLFGTRHTVFDRTHPEFGCAIEIFLQKYASGIEDVIRKDKHFRGVKEVTCFGEFFGPWSFAGQHDPKHPALNPNWFPNGRYDLKPNADNTPKDVALFDISIHKKGFVAPREFVNTFGHLPIAEIAYQGNLNEVFTTAIREAQLIDGMNPAVFLYEGVVCKGLNGPAPHGIWRVKIKTLHYLAELKKRFAADWERYWE